MRTTLEMIRQALEYTETSGYQIEDIRKRGWEFYFIKHRLDQNRAKEVEHIGVTVYKLLDDGRNMGSARAEISPRAGRKEIEQTIGQLAEEAGYVVNPAYTLNKGANVLPVDHKGVDVEGISRDFIETMQNIPETSTEDINSYEIFASEVTRRTINSEGVDYTAVYPDSMIEVVTNARRDGKEIELYRMYRSGTCDRAGLSRDVSETLRYGKDKLIAVNTPALKKSAVVFSTSAALELYNYFFYRTRARMIYQRISDAKIGTSLIGDEKGDKVTMYAVHELENSSRNFLIDEEGAMIHDRCLVKDNVPQNLWGSRQYSQYLGLKDSSIVYNYSVEGGSRKADELRRGDFLEVVEFSDFRCDPMTSDIAGEIRLGYWHHDGKVTAVSGGSVSGSLKELAKEMYLSRETRQYNNSVIPEVTRLEDVTVTGIE